MLPIIQKEVVEKRKWATEQEVADYYAIGQCTPGVIAVNTATFIGYKNKGILGGIVATLGVVFPSIIIISIIAMFISNFAISFLIFLVVFIASAFFSISPIIAVIISGIIGWSAKFIGGVKK